MNDQAATLNIINLMIARHWPHAGVIVDTVAYPSGHFAIRMYEENLQEFSDEHRRAILMHALKIRDFLKKTSGIEVGVEREMEIADKGRKVVRVD